MNTPTLTASQKATVLGDAPAFVLEHGTATVRLPMPEAEFRALQIEYDQLAAELEGMIILRVRNCVRDATLRVLAADQELREAQISLDNCLYARDREEVTNPVDAIKANRLATIARKLNLENALRQTTSPSNVAQKESAK